MFRIGILEDTVIPAGEFSSEVYIGYPSCKWDKPLHLDNLFWRAYGMLSKSFNYI